MGADPNRNQRQSSGQGAKPLKKALKLKAFYCLDVKRNGQNLLVSLYFANSVNHYYSLHRLKLSSHA